MKLRAAGDHADPVNLTATPVHLGLGGTAVPLNDFDWHPDTLADYEAATADDGADGRMVMIFDFDSTQPGTQWETHRAGAELVVCLSGQLTLIQQVGEREHPIDLNPGQAAINPPNVWHTIDGRISGQLLTITPGRGTSHKPRRV